MSERADYTPVALYARVSSDCQDVDLSVAAQMRALKDYADKNGYSVAREYVDEARSRRERPNNQDRRPRVRGRGRERTRRRQTGVPQDDRRGHQARGPFQGNPCLEI